MGTGHWRADADAVDPARADRDGRVQGHSGRQDLHAGNGARGSTTNGIVSNPFLAYAFRIDRYTITVTINDDGTWSYAQETLLIIPGQAEPFRHTDKNMLRKVSEPILNRTAQAEADGVEQSSNRVIE